MAQIKLSGRKQRLVVFDRNGKPVARLDYRRICHDGKVKHVIGGRVRLLPKPHGEE